MRDSLIADLRISIDCDKYEPLSAAIRSLLDLFYFGDGVDLFDVRWLVHLACLLVQRERNIFWTELAPEVV